MTNTILLFDTCSIDMNNDTITLNDFTNISVNIPEKYINDSKYFEYYRVGDGERLDSISYNKYGDPSKWDIILMMNNLHSGLLLPKDYNIVISKSDIMFDNWESIENNKNRPAWFKDLKKKYFLSLANIENEKYRNIKILKSEYILELVYELDNIKNKG